MLAVALALTGCSPNPLHTAWVALTKERPLPPSPASYISPTYDIVTDTRAAVRAQDDEIKKLQVNIVVLTNEITQLNSAIFCLHQELTDPKHHGDDFYSCQDNPP